MELDRVETMLLKSVRTFLQKELAPIAELIENEGAAPRELYKKMGDLGFLGSFFPEEWGGSGLSVITRAIISEETAKISAGFDISLFADIILFARAIMKHGTEKQKEKYLIPVLRGEKIGAMGITEPNAGSDAMAVESVATKQNGDYLINGSKTFITNAPIADFFVVIVRTSKEDRKIDGGTWFILERGMKGLKTGKPFEKLGMRSSPTGEVFMDDILVSKGQMLGQEGKGFYYLMDSLDVERVMEGASTIGIAQACLENSIEYASHRYAFGKPIGEYQLVKELIAEMAMGIELSRNYLWELCRRVDKGEKVTRQAAMLKLFSSRMASQAAKDAVQIMGGYGYMKESKVERYFRDAKHHEIGAGTTEIMKLIIAREVMNTKKIKSQG